MGVIPNITEEDQKAIRSHMEATLRANLRDAERDMSQAGDDLMLAKERFEAAREAYWAAVRTLDAFANRKLSS